MYSAFKTNRKYCSNIHVHIFIQDFHRIKDAVYLNLKIPDYCFLMNIIVGLTGPYIHVHMFIQDFYGIKDAVYLNLKIPYFLGPNVQVFTNFNSCQTNIHHKMIFGILWACSWCNNNTWSNDKQIFSVSKYH